MGGGGREQSGDKWDGKRFAWGDEHLMQGAHDALFSCALETCMVLLTNVTH